MKARDSVKNYPSALREMTNYSVRGIKKICADVGARPSAGEQEFEAQKRMSAELEPCCDTVSTQEFKVSAGKTSVSIIISLVFIAAAAVMFFFDLGAFSVIPLVPAAVILFALAFGKNILAPFFPKKTSHNIIGVKKASGEAKRRIIFSANCDSTTKKRSADGAVGAACNLSGCFAAMSVVKFMQRHDITPENTDIWIVLTGSGKLGRSGAKTFAADIKDGVETVFIGFDTLADPNGIAVSAGDADTSALLKSAAEITGCTLRDNKASFAASEAGTVSKKGIKSACLSAVPSDGIKEKEDKAENLNLSAIENGIDMALELTFLFDSQGK